MRVGFFSPLPPARTGVADYSLDLLGALRQASSGSANKVEVHAREADVFLYHLGNNPLHREIYRRALEVPGVVVLHDAVLHHLLLGSLSERDYLAEFIYNYGPWAEALASDLWRRRAHSGTDPAFFRYPMLKRVIQRSLAVIVHNPGAAALVKAQVPEAIVHEIPHLFELPELPPGYEIIRLRQQLGIGAQTFLFGVFGHLRESKRLAAVLRAFERCRGAADVALLVAGDFASSDLARSLEPLLRSDRIRRIGYAPERDFWKYASAVDACLNLRYPTAGETSGISVRLMGLGKPVLMSAGCETARFPDTTCLKVDAGPAEEEMLTEFMLWLAQFPADARAIGARASGYIREFHSPRRVAGLYWDALLACYHRGIQIQR